MTRDSPARHAIGRARPILLACACLLAAAPARADAAAVVLFKDGAPPDARAWRARVASRERAVLVVDDVQRWAAERAGGVSGARLQPLSLIERLLARARSEAAALDEDAALATLAEAARAGEQIADVPGAALWNAEIQLAIGVTAAQAGMPALAREAFRRAATLDRGRILLPGEAPPAAVELYAIVEREVAVSALGEIEVQVDAAGAQVFLDDAARGPAPSRVRVPVGRHVLRIHAAGCRPYGAFIDVLPGVRPALRVRPAPEPALQAAAALERAARAGDYDALLAAAAALEREGAGVASVHVVERSARGARALLVRCDARGCRAPLRFARGAALRFSPDGALDRANLDAGRSWLSDAERWSGALAAERAPSWWQRWYVWGGIAAAAAAAAAVLALSAAQEPERSLRVVLEPEALGR